MFLIAILQFPFNSGQCLVHGPKEDLKLPSYNLCHHQDLYLCLGSGINPILNGHFVSKHHPFELFKLLKVAYVRGLSKHFPVLHHLFVSAVCCIRPNIELKF